MTPLCQITRNGGCPSRTAGKIQKSPTGCAILKSQISTSPHQKVRRIPVFQSGHSLPLFPLPLPCPSSSVPLGGGFQRWGPRPPAFVSFQGGAGGNRNPPAFLFRGLGGHSLFKREYPLGFSVPKRYSSAGNPGIFAPKIPSPYPKWEFPCGSRKIPVLTESSIPSPYRSD